MSARRRAVERFRTVFGREPAAIARAPGRVNLIGEHTDYNDGFVLPVALAEAVFLAFSPRSDRRVRIDAGDTGEAGEFSLEGLVPGPPGVLEYAKGVAHALSLAGVPVRGFTGALASDLPIGAGLSSSAALGVALALALAPDAPDPMALARIVRRGENEWIGVPCGIMDPAVICRARAGHALRIDCRSLEVRDVPLPGDAAFVLLDSGTRRRLAGSAYDARRAECAEAARLLGVPSLRDAPAEDLGALAGLPLARARHVVGENARVLDFEGALAAGDLAEAGRILDRSHESLRRDYEVSSEALDRAVATARADPACLGARLTGAGFGGFAVALVRAGAERGFLDRSPGARPVSPAAGAAVSPP